MKVETHNHPTAISPFPGAATGSGGEIRDEGATGRGAQAQGRPHRLHGLATCASPALDAAVGERDYGKPEPHRLARSTIMLDGPIGGAAFNNEFGRPEPRRLLPHVFEQTVAGERARLPQADHDRRRPRQHPRRARRTRTDFPPGALLIQLGGPGMLIGLGGGAASSMATGANAADLDFDSVQRGNAEMQRRCQEVIDRCWQLGDAQPDPVDPRRRRRRPVERASRSWSTAAARGARFDLRAVPRDEPGMSPREIWCNEAQERYVLAIAPPIARRVRARSASASAARSPWSARATADGSASSSPTRTSATRPSTCRWTCCSASRRG